MHNTANETSRTFMDASSKDDQEEEVAPSRQIDISSPRQFGSSGSTTGSDTNSASSTRKRRRSLSSGGGETGSTLQERWDEMFERLRKYKEEHGSCNVPNRYGKDPQLGFWVSTQRRQYRVLTSGGSNSSALTVQRAQKLINLGFEWSAKDPRMVPWETRFQQLKNFAEKYGHAQIPIGWEENVPLSNWVSKQRQEYKLLQKGKPSRLSKERIDKLNEIGFVWEAKRGAPRQVIMPGERSLSTTAAAAAAAAVAPNNAEMDEEKRLQSKSTAKTKKSRRAEPVSPRSSNTAAAHGQGAHPPTPVARMPPVEASFPYGVETTYPSNAGGYPPSRHDVHYSLPPHSLYYPPDAHGRFLSPHVSSSWSHDSSHGPMHPAPPQGHSPRTWPMPRTGRILTPLYPMEPPPGTHRYQMPTPHDPRYYEVRPATAYGQAPYYPPYRGDYNSSNDSGSPSHRREGEERSRPTDDQDYQPRPASS